MREEIDSENQYQWTRYGFPDERNFSNFTSGWSQNVTISGQSASSITITNSGTTTDNWARIPLTPFEDPVRAMSSKML